MWFSQPLEETLLQSKHTEGEMKPAWLRAGQMALCLFCPISGCQAGPVASPATSRPGDGGLGPAECPSLHGPATSTSPPGLVQPLPASVALKVAWGSSAVRLGTVTSLEELVQRWIFSSVSLHFSEKLSSLYFVVWPLLSLHIFIWELSIHHAGDSWSALQHMEIKNNPELQHFLPFSPLRLLEAT